MAKQKKEKTPAMKAFESAKAARDKADEAVEKNATDANKRAAETAQKAYEKAKAELNRERFLTIGTSRVKKVRISLAALAKVANRNNYEFSDDDVKKMFAGIGEKLNVAKVAFDRALQSGAKKSGQRATDDFSFT